MVTNLAIQRGWATRQVNFSNAFVQAELKGEVYVELPKMFGDEHNHGHKDGVVLRLNKSLIWTCSGPSVLVQSLDFKVSTLDPGMYYGRGMMIILWA
jgi:hypothetical protein